MRTITTNAYKFHELSDHAQTRAVEVLRDKLGGEWWDQGDNDDVRDTMIYTLAEKLQTPGWDTYGCGDFPGINGVTMDGWSLDRGQALAVSGRLDRGNAPGLPWSDEFDHVTLTGKGSDETRLEVELTCTCPDDYEMCVGLENGDDTGPIEQVVRDALSEAWSSGDKEADYKAGEENARQVAEGYEFTADGELV